MPTYALLGATGATGSAILRYLLFHPPQDLTLNLFIRSRSKLLAAFPTLSKDVGFTLNIIEGLPNEAPKLQQCLRNADVVFSCIASNSAVPGMTLMYDTALNIIDALKANQTAQGEQYKTPTILQLRSASLNSRLGPQTPWPGHQMALFCFHHVYADLDKACKLFASTATSFPGLLDYIFIDPPSIHDPDGRVATGYKLLLTDEDGKQETVLSYADLGAAFCKVAERRRELAGREVGVSKTGKVNETWGVLMGYMAQGLKSRVWG